MRLLGRSLGAGPAAGKKRKGGKAARRGGKGSRGGVAAMMDQVDMLMSSSGVDMPVGGGQGGVAGVVASMGIAHSSSLGECALPLLSPLAIDVEDGASSATQGALQGLVGRAVKVCMGGACRKRGAQALLTSLEGGSRGEHNVEVVGCKKCMGRCKRGPVVRVEEKGQTSTYNYVGVNHVSTLLGHA